MIKILIVDDEKMICQYIGDFFKQRGHVPIVETNPKNALKVIEKEKPQIILLDVLMPQMSGLDLLKDIKNKHKDEIKVIMVTVADDKETIEKARQLGSDDFIKKPFDTNYLEDVVMTKISELLNFRGD